MKFLSEVDFPLDGDGDGWILIEAVKERKFSCAG